MLGDQEAAAPGLTPTGPLLPRKSLPQTVRLPKLGQCCRHSWALAWAPGPTLLQQLSSQPPPCLLLPQSYTPTVFERLAVNLEMKGKPLNLQIWDTAGGCAGLQEGHVGGGAPHAQEPRPAPFLLTREAQPISPISKGQVLARIRVPRNLNLLCSCFPQQRVANCVPETRGVQSSFLSWDELFLAS